MGINVNFETVVAIEILATYATMMVCEAYFSGNAYPVKPLWCLHGFGFFALNACFIGLLSFILPIEWLSTFHLYDCHGLSTIWGALLGYLLVSFFIYWWHRAAHHYPFLWQWCHQVHHAPQRVDMGGSTIFHPLEAAIYTLFTFTVTDMMLGLSPEATLLTLFITQFYGFFVHMNIRTPRWLGYLIQRPEAHGLHHHRRVTKVNYSDLPLWDLLFGTFCNPAEFSCEPMGFADGADEHYVALLLGQDVLSLESPTQETLATP